MKTFNITDLKEINEEIEAKTLSPYACLSKNSQGREVPEKDCPLRMTFQRDRDRILHSKAFRRLKHKTQVFISPVGDHYRTRLTHTLEVSQISRTIARALRLNEDLTEAIALGHDLGHTPFGHTGENALNELMPGGFAHNEQSIRVVTFIENLNLTKESLDGILHHNGETQPFTLEGQVVKISDRIAYLNHDVDDAFRAGLLKLGDLPKECTDYFGSKKGDSVAKMVFDIVENSYEKPFVSMSEYCREKTDILRSWMFENIYKAKKEENKARKIVIELFKFYEEKLTGKYDLDEIALKRLVADYIASMTDRYAIKKYKQHFLPLNEIYEENDGFLQALIEKNNLKERT